MAAFTARRLTWCGAQAQVREHMASKLNLGCGFDKREGWLNVAAA
jgi:hypothetical protein